MVNEEDIKCDICKKVKWAFIRVDTEKRGLFNPTFNVCVDCFKNEDIEWIIKEEMKKQSEELIKNHQDKIDEIKKRLEVSLNPI